MSHQLTWSVLRFLRLRLSVIGKRLACVINSSERSGFIRFYVYLCLMSDILYLGFSSTGISEFSDMGKYWIIYCCPITCSLVKI